MDLMLSRDRKIESVGFIAMLLASLGIPQSRYYVGLYPALLMLFTPATTMGPWGIYAMACSTALGLCAIKDGGMELFLLLSHFVLHYASSPKAPPAVPWAKARSAI